MSDRDPRVAVIGAGLTGRGFLGRLLAEAAVPFILIDKDESLVDRLRREGRYRVSFFGGARGAVDVRPAGAFPTAEQVPDDVLRSVGAMFVSVGPGNLAAVGAWLPDLLERRLSLGAGGLTIIMCENAVDASGTLSRSIAAEAPSDARVSYADAAVFCTTVSPDPGSLDIMSEDYPRLECSRSGLRGDMPPLPFLSPVDRMDELMRRKLYTYNTVSAVLAYEGWRVGYRMLAEAAADPGIAARARQYLEEIGAAFVQTMGVRPEDQRELARRAMSKFSNPAIEDPVDRNARDPARKLGPGERIFGALEVLRSTGGNTAVLARTAALMLLYERQSSGRAAPAPAAEARARLRSLTRLSDSDPFIDEVLEEYRRL